MYLVSDIEGLAWPRGRIIQPSLHSGMHALVIYHSMNTSNDLQKKKILPYPNNTSLVPKR